MKHVTYDPTGWDETGVERAAEALWVNQTGEWSTSLGVTWRTIPETRRRWWRYQALATLRAYADWETEVNGGDRTFDSLEEFEEWLRAQPAADGPAPTSVELLALRLARMGDPADSTGVADRRTVTLTDLIEAAREALRRDEEVRKP